MYGVSVRPWEAEEIELSSFRHKGLKQLYEQDDARKLAPGMTDKLRKLLFAMQTADDLDQLRRFPGWRLHALKGEMKDLWSLTVTGNWRIVFHYDPSSNRAQEIDLVDYH